MRISSWLPLLLFFRGETQGFDDLQEFFGIFLFGGSFRQNAPGGIVGMAKSTGWPCPGSLFFNG
ncbi:MAG: hypothetical protein DMG93_04740 [Acidobacteria bacterium]|nr:MAG: hypothetical protein DMG93_04740 [Acidobacteriota bacterium]